MGCCLPGSAHASHFPQTTTSAQNRQLRLVPGGFTLTDEPCNVTTYGPGQGFSTGPDIHQAVAGPNGADFYSLYVLRKDVDVLRTNADAPVCASH